MITPTKLELDLLHLYYNFADGITGVVDMETANQYAAVNYGILLPDEGFTVTQADIDLLVAFKRLPDIRTMLDR